MYRSNGIHNEIIVSSEWKQRLHDFPEKALEKCTVWTTEKYDPLYSDEIQQIRDWHNTVVTREIIVPSEWKRRLHAFPEKPLKTSRALPNLESSPPLPRIFFMVFFKFNKEKQMFWDFIFSCWKAFLKMWGWEKKSPVTPPNEAPPRQQKSSVSSVPEKPAPSASPLVQTNIMVETSQPAPQTIVETFKPAITYFAIQNHSNPPIYTKLSGASPEKLDDCIDTLILKPYQDLKHKWKQNPPATVPEGFDRLMEKVDHPFHSRRNHLKNKIKSADSVEKCREIFAEFITKALGDTLIKFIVPTFYGGLNTAIKTDSALAKYYIRCIKELNTFLAELGIKTRVQENDTPLDYDFYTPAIVADKSNETHDSHKEDCAKQVMQYAYYFSEEYILAEGQVICWKVI